MAALIGFTFFFGIIAAEFYHSDLVHRLADRPLYFALPVGLTGLLFMSYPSSFPTHSAWSAVLSRLGPRLFPPVHELERAWGSVGSTLFLLAVLASPHARRAFSHPWLRWLGSISFPIYLLHGLFLRTVLTWLVFGGADPEPTQIDVNGSPMDVALYPQPGSLRILVSIAVMTPLLLVAAHWWNARVEPLFGRITRAAEELMWVPGSDAAKPKPGASDGVATGVMGMSNGKPMLPLRKE